MTARRIQYCLAAVFFVLGGWALLAPANVIALTFLPAFRGGAALPFAVACFGAQACIAGLFAATARFTATTFLAYALALIPFFVFDLWFTLGDPVLTPLGGWADAAGNIAMMALCLAGYRQLGPGFAGGE